MKFLAHLVFRIVLALWVGGIAMFTFVVTPAIFRSLARDEAGRVVGLLFPVYYPYNLILSLVALLAFVWLVWGAWRPVHWVHLLGLVLAVAANAYVLFGLHSEIRAVKAEVASFETTSPEHPSRRRFSRLHAKSAAINLFVLVDGVVLMLLTPVLRR